MDIHLNAHVDCTDGRIGRLENIIVNDKTSFSYDKPVVEDERTSLSSAQLYYWTGYSGDLLSWLLKQVPNEGLMFNISIDGANAGIPQN